MASNKILKIQKIDFQWEMENPFIFCAHHQDNYPKGNYAQVPPSALDGRRLGNDFSGKDGFSLYHGITVPGFPMHPHRGFETITIVLQGFVDHFDSKGAEGRYGNGDVQWLTTGAGCQHAEMFPCVYSDKPNPLNLFQIWLNLPRKDKFIEPYYKMLWAEDIPIVHQKSENEKSSDIRIIAGNFAGTESLSPCPNSWANDKKNNVRILLIKMEPEASIVLPPVSKTLNRNLYYYDGNDVVKIDGEIIHSSNRIKLSGNDEIIIKNGSKNSNLILLEAEPIQEPVVQYGPFVMNSEQEIRQAFDDYERTQFGGWIWERPDPVHPEDSGRFAKYEDGTVETKGEPIGNLSEI